MKHNKDRVTTEGATSERLWKGVDVHVNSLITAMILLISIPVGGIAGQLSQKNRMLPLILNLCLLLVEILVVLIITRNANPKLQPHE